MNDKDLQEMMEYNRKYTDALLNEEIFGGDYTSAVELEEYKRLYDETFRDLGKYKHNWKELKNHVKFLRKISLPSNNGYAISIIDGILTKMEELENESMQR